MSPVLEARQLAKTYVGGDGSPIEVLRGVNLQVEPGEFVAIVGASGAGKSTLLHLLGALDAPTGGEVFLAGAGYRTFGPEELAAMRNRKIGFVFQFHHLLRDFTAVENVALPLQIGGTDDVAALRHAQELLETVGLEGRQHHRPAQLSGGEQQRVAVARALAGDPVVVLADEPSGNLDLPNAERLHVLLGSLSARFGTALVVATHNRLLAERADRILRLDAGVLVPEEGIGEEALRHEAVQPMP